MAKTLKIGNAQAFWGDRGSAAAQLVQQVPDLDVLTLDYLAEVSMSILAVQKEKDSKHGYARDFVSVVESLIPHWKEGSSLKVITNAGGLNPQGCAAACKELLQQQGITNFTIAVITGDDVLDDILASDDSQFSNIDTKQSIDAVKGLLVTANAYLGSKAIVEALQQNVNIVITGRVADPCLTAAPCIAHFKWQWDDYDNIAAALIAGHLIECGTQVTGGFSTNWMDIPAMAEPGYPVIEMDADGTFVITKGRGSDGTVTIETVKEQLLYEIQDPDAYLSPDATVSFLSLSLTEESSDRIRVSGAKGRPPPPQYKVSATYRDGYKVEGMIALFGRDAKEKGYRCGDILRQRIKHLGYDLQNYHVECIGAGDIVPGLFESDPMEVMLRIAAKDSRKEALEALAKEIAPLVTSGPQGVTGYSSGRPKVRPVFSFWPTLIPASKVDPQIQIIEV